MPDTQEILVMISNPEEFPTWPPERKRDRYERVMRWHAYATDIHKRGKLPQVWGSHEILSRARFTTSLGVLVAVYRVETLQEFDELLANDPLRDVSQYIASPLCSLFKDKDDDEKRLEKARKRLAPQSDLARLFQSSYRSLFHQSPDFVGKYPHVEPTNPPVDVSAPGTSDSLEILVVGVNPNEYITLWDDTRKLIHYEKVLWWHDYMSMMISEKKITHAWGTHDFCHIGGVSGNSAAAVAVYRVRNWEEFDELYRLDPIRDSSLFWTVVLQPLADQRKRDARRVNGA